MPGIVMADQLIVLGASTRAAAFSALRAGLRPWCVDLFGDADLRAHCPVVTIPRGQYPLGFLRAIEQGPAVPWMFTGALENHPRLVSRLSKKRLLWGNVPRVLRRARSPGFVASIYEKAGIGYPLIQEEPPKSFDGKRWLKKRLAGAGGAGISFWNGNQIVLDSRPAYFQEYVEGAASAAVYLGDGVDGRLLGVTHQLVGQDWLHAAPFHYCGSIGPLALTSPTEDVFGRLGRSLAQGCGLKGLFGVDCVLRKGTVWPVEVNPRYTASMEILEYASGCPFLSLHRREFDPEEPVPGQWPALGGWEKIGKAILYARASLVFPNEGPWCAAHGRLSPVADLPPFADIPEAGQRIRKGWPIMTIFARAGSMRSCLDSLRDMATDLDRWLFRQ
jgi:predicted ATP-grasp superfamily ATP-dependent carboligase